MKPPPFEYYRPGSLDEAVQLMARYGPDAKILAGGQSLLPMLAMRQAQPKHLVDLQRVGELAGIRSADGRLRIGAMVRQREIERDSSVPPLVRCAVRHIGISRSAIAERWVGRCRIWILRPSGRQWRWRWRR
jgi:aerobic carbon-monoxide dehydrogenase medium subunit